MTRTLANLTRLVLKFRKDRDWAQFHTPKELGISLVVEAAELLELMQWRRGRQLQQQLRRRREDIADELADCLHSILLLAHDLDIDLADAFVKKLDKTAKKYPVHLSKGRPNKSTELGG